MTQFISFLQDQDEEQIIDNQFTNIHDVKKYIQKTFPIKYNYITQNFIWKEFEFQLNNKRIKLPLDIYKQKKLQLWSILKDCIGKDLTKFTLPIYLNEPLTAVQKYAESFQYLYLYEKAASEPDSCLRMAYLVCINSFIVNSFSHNRWRKPFNSLLGETYEYIDENVKYICEQVSHHPPISAYQASGKDWEFTGKMDYKVSFGGTCINIEPLGLSYIKLNKFNETISHNKNKTSLNNLFFGEIYCDHVGNMLYTNHTTGDTASVDFFPSGWLDKSQSKIQGVIRDAQQNTVYEIEGCWNTYFKIINKKTGQEQTLWQIRPQSQEDFNQFNITPYAKNLNHFSLETLARCCPTDSRPDLRAYELGNHQFADLEKSRLEQKQRDRKVQNENNNQSHQVKWFQNKTHPITKQEYWEYKQTNGYWQSREQGKFGEVLDIY